MTGPRIIVVGSLNLDLTLPVPRLPQPGETVLSSGPAQPGFGGKGANQAAAAAAFGAAVAMIGRIGDDEAGQQILADLTGRGIDVSQVLVTPGARTGGATVAVNPDGENIILSRVGVAITCFQDACAHLGYAISGGEVDGGLVTCPHHGFRYDLASGECLTAPEVQLRSHAVRLVGDRVEVRLAA